MAEKKFFPSFDDIVFEFRNKEYGAYILRKQYNRNMAVALAVGLFFILGATITPFIMASVRPEYKNDIVIVDGTFVAPPKDDIPAPPPPPPAPPTDMPQTAPKFVAPEIVDSVTDTRQQMITAEEAITTVKDEEAPTLLVEPEKKEEIIDDTPSREPLIFVEEMPEFIGGAEALNKFIAESIKYPALARENGIKGKVFVRFCVNYKGEIQDVSLARGVDPILDEEAVRVVKTLPKWRPGKQAGKAVNVWYTVPINFKLQEGN